MNPGKRLSFAYCAWAAVAVTLAVVSKGLTPENITRLLVIGFLLVQLAFRPALMRSFPRLSPRARFIVLATLLACVVEGLHMISVPVFPSLRIGPQTPLATAFSSYLIDLAFTVPAYVVIFGVIWHFLSRYTFAFWPYTLAMGLAQTLGDGGLFFFAGAPAMLVFLPYPMTNYHAVNVLPFLSVRDQLPPDRSSSRRKYLAIPAVVLAYLICGALIRLVGKAAGLAT
jgi:hypothetical protein